MENVELLLSEEFVKFSAEIQQIYATKKAKTAEFKALHEAWKSEMSELDAGAKKAQEEWEEWKDGHTKEKK